MKIKRRNKLGILLSLFLTVTAAALFTAPQSNALTAAQNKSDHLRASMTQAPRTDRSSRETSNNRRTACKRSCEDKYDSCLVSKKAKGWSDDRAEKTCGLAARSCKAGCNRR
jgi:hypothetical protein